MRIGSQFALGLMLLSLVWGAGPALSWQRAPRGLEVLQRAEGGDARAQTRLGFMFDTGRGAPQSLVAAVYWYQRAAEQGDPDAQYFLGVCYNLGRGVVQDTVVAYKWLNLSASRTRPGEEREHRARMRDAVASKLDPALLALAQSLAIAWQPKPER
jgi:TPR repeat protein